MGICVGYYASIDLFLLFLVVSTGKPFIARFIIVYCDNYL